MTFISNLLDLVYPNLCLNCSRTLVISETYICTECEAKLPLTQYHKELQNPMIKSLWGRINIDFASAFLFFNKAGITQVLLHELKYKGNKEIGIYLGKLFGNQIKTTDFVNGVDYLIPVPLHKKKLKMRGYNQSEFICEGLSQVLTIPIAFNLKRISFSDSQTKKGRFARWLNVSEKFEVTNPELLYNKRILIVDDVFTTGATIEACYNAIKKVSKCEIGVITLSVASH